jgi:TRAP-type C4-dicarboxylate transport system substrate-binding protein
MTSGAGAVKLAAMPNPPLIPSAALAAAVVALAGCGGSSADKSGATSSRPVTLTLEMPDADSQSGREFARAVAARSDGSVRIRLGTVRYASEDPAHELQLARAIERGDVQGGYLPARAWSAAEVTPFQVMQAPFQLTTPAAAAAFATSDGARAALDALPDSVVGLALVPDQLRRLAAIRPLLSPRALEGARIRIVDDPQTAIDVEALGAVPVQGLRSTEVLRELSQRRLAGAETSSASVYSNGYGSVAPHLSGYALFPKYQSVVLSRKAWDRLSDSQQEALRAAGADTVTWASRRLASDDAAALQKLCRGSVTVDVPSAEQLKALVAATQSVIETLPGDKASAAVLAAMRAAPGAGAQRTATPLPKECTAPAAGPTPAGKTAPFPEGTYVTKVDRKDFVAHDVTNPTALHDVVFTTRLRDGHWAQIQDPVYPTQCPGTFAKAEKECAGTYKVDGDRVTFRWNPGTGLEGTTEVVRWSFFNGVLHFENIDVADTGSQTIYDTPWRKVG